MAIRTATQYKRFRTVAGGSRTWDSSWGSCYPERFFSIESDSTTITSTVALRLTGGDSGQIEPQVTLRLRGFPSAHAYLFSSDPTTGDPDSVIASAIAVAHVSVSSPDNFKECTFLFPSMTVSLYQELYVMFGGYFYGEVSTYPPKTLIPSAVAPEDDSTVTAQSTLTFDWNVSGNAEQQNAFVHVDHLTVGEVDGSATRLSTAERLAPGAHRWWVVTEDAKGVLSSSAVIPFTLQYISTSYLSPYNTPTSGSIDRFSANRFSCEMRANGTPYVDWTLRNPVFHWMPLGGGAYTDVPMSVSSDQKSASVTIPANTFTRTPIIWYMTAEDQDGNNRRTPETGTYQLSTEAVPISAAPVSPVDVVESNSTPTDFVWTTASSIPSPRAASELQYSADGSTWTQFGTVSGDAVSYTAPANTLPSGQLWWRVRVQNVDGIWGAWSDPVQFVSYGAPVVSNVIADGRPFSTISWAVPEQFAFKVTVDGIEHGPYYAPDARSYTLPDFLSDGEHSAEVSVQNDQGQWSVSAGTTFSVLNVPGQPVNLSGRMGRDAELRWSCADQTADFLIYRDDVQIGHASGYRFDDRTVLGYHSWRVVNRLPGGYYTASNTVSGTLCTEVMALALLSGGPWLELPLSEQPTRSTTAALARSVALRQFAGREWPDLEAAPYKTMQISFDVSFLTAQAAQAAAFETLIGEPVIWKTPAGEAFVGVLGALSRRQTCTARSYTATVQRIHWRGYVDADA